jgi:uncharacterized membrane protein
MAGRSSGRLLALTAAALLLFFMNTLAAYYAAHYALLVTYLVIGIAAFIVLVKIPDEYKDRMYLLTVVCVSLSLFFVSEFVSPYISGEDVQLEFYVFSQVLTNGHWHAAITSSSTGIFDTALSITLLPAVLNIETSIDGTLIFKLLFPLLYSIVPIILYKVYRQFLGPAAAFLSVFFFMVDPTFYTEMLQLGRQMIAEIFLALLLLMAVSKRKQNKTISGAVLTLVLSLGLITAHYSIAYVFLLFMVTSLLLVMISSRVERLWSSGIVLACFVLTITWFLLLTGGAAVVDLTTNMSNVWTGIINDLFSPAARPIIVQNALFLNAPTPGILHVLSRATQYVAVASILIGFLILLRKRVKTVAERQLVPVMTLSIGILIATVTVPFLGGVLDFARVFHLTLIFISPCAFIGVQGVVSQFRRIIPHTVRVSPADARVPLAALIFLYFIFTSGWMWAATRDPYPTSISIDWQRMRDSTDLSIVRGYYAWYDVPQDVVSAYWLKDFSSPTQPVCADLYSTFHVLASYGGRDPNNPSLAHIFETDTCTYSQDEYVYFSEFNAVSRAYGVTGAISISDISARVGMKDRVYSGVAIVYYS